MANQNIIAGINDNNQPRAIRVSNNGNITITEVVTTKPGLAANVHEPAAATPAVVTKAAGGAGVVNVIGQVAWSLSEAPAAHVNLMIEDGVGTTIFSVDVTSAGPGFISFNPPMRGSANTAMIITLASGAGAVIGKVSVHTWTE